MLFVGIAYQTVNDSKGDCSNQGKDNYIYRIKLLTNFQFCVEYNALMEIVNHFVVYTERPWAHVHVDHRELFCQR